ncbi:MAG TPA: hypothetical protein VFB60_28345 [Ktedonobacteraceae bacterium]|nr:hypothetical protein [Ktedonobacteraceae bacterium]
MGQITVYGGGMQVVQYRTASGHTSSRLAYNQSEQLEINDSGDKLYLDFCFFTCGSPTAGPADVLPGDQASASAGLWHGICLTVTRNGQTVFNRCTDGSERTTQAPQRVVEVTDEELQNMQQAGIPVREIRRARIQISDEELQKVQLSSSPSRGG